MMNGTFNRLFPMQLWLSLAVVSAGCSKQPFLVAPTSGICTCHGEPMPGGLIVLNPIRDPSRSDKETMSGKPATGLIQPDGSFVLSTYGNNDGAVIGRHKVVLNLAVLEDQEIDEKPPCRKAPKDLVVEISPEGTSLEIELADSGSSK